MTSRRFQDWVRRRFVFLCEVAGYTISAAVGLFLLYAALTQVDVEASLVGTLEPFSAPLTVQTETLVLAPLAAPGARVLPGQPVLRVTRNPEEQRVVAARRRMEEALALLGDGSGTGQILGQALENLPSSPEGETVAAPVAGHLRPLPPDRAGTVVEPGQPIGWIDDYGRATFRSVTGTSSGSGRILAGQAVRAFVPGVAPPLTGTVVKVTPSGNGEELWVDLDTVPAEASDALRALALEEADPRMLETRAEVVIDRRSLFSRIFGRR